jgi:penicillin-binding protein 1C
VARRQYGEGWCSTFTRNGPLACLPWLFLGGTEQTHQRASEQLSVQRRFGIASPRDGSVFALDPDIPIAAQRLTFEGEPGTWVLDGRRIGHGSSITWPPWPGRHELTLLDRDGRQAQVVRFEVRGATLRQRVSSNLP